MKSLDGTKTLKYNLKITVIAWLGSVPHLSVSNEKDKWKKKFEGKVLLSFLGKLCATVKTKYDLDQSFLRPQVWYGSKTIKIDLMSN